MPSKNSMTLTAALSRCMSETIAQYQGVNHDEIFSCLLATITEYARQNIGVEKTMIMLAVKMAIVSDHNVDKIQQVVDVVKKTSAMFKAAPESLLGFGMFTEVDTVVRNSKS